MEPYLYWRKKLKDEGFRITATRDTILRIILDSHSESAVEEIHKKALDLDPEIGIATVYRNINLLQKIGLIKKAGINNNKLRYVLSEFNIESLEKESDVFKSIEYLKELNGIRDRMSKQLEEVEKIKIQKEIKLEEMLKNTLDVDAIIKRYGNDRGNLIQILIEAQEKYNWLPKHVLYQISELLNIPLTKIYNIASFYKFFDLEPRGKHSIVVCTGTACHVRGSMNLLQRIVNVLGVGPGDTTDDLKFTLDTVNCMGACALGPVMMVDKQYFSNPSTAKLKKIFETFN